MVMRRHRGTHPLDFATGPDISPRLLVMSTEETLLIPQQGEVWIGRADPQDTVQPDVDLGPCGGLQAGVSCHHARLVVRSGKYLLEDLHSKNGTFVNSVPLEPEKPMRVRTGDIVRFGELTMVFYEK